MKLAKLPSILFDEYGLSNKVHHEFLSKKIKLNDAVPCRPLYYNGRYFKSPMLVIINMNIMLLI